MLKVSIIGTGNVAKHLYNAFFKAEIVEIIQVVGRNKKALSSFGIEEKTTSDFSEIEDADIYVVAVSDSAISAVSQKLESKSGLVAHTSGASSIEMLSKHKAYGVFYPLQTFSKDQKIDFRKVPVCVEGSTKSNMTILKKLGSEISESVHEVDSEQRQTLHLSAVFVNNFTNHLFYIGNKICEENQLPFDLLKPLIEETVQKLKSTTPFNAQTGPARRGDQETLISHMEQLGSLQDKEIYNLLSQSIQSTYGKKL
ncbi:Rossmann-like domain-containing protein [Flavobacteriaceae bacterium MAR_2009_75]|nr:Rossmann-like domain-containing protein [Flavobacteriaceae bacterium MAR_2009_75]